MKNGSVVRSFFDWLTASSNYRTSSITASQCSRSFLPQGQGKSLPGFDFFLEWGPAGASSSNSVPPELPIEFWKFRKACVFEVDDKHV